MQTELKTAKDEKLVDLDTSGEGAEVELEDKSHGAVKPCLLYTSPSPRD